jgi:hypothetical protein
MEKHRISKKHQKWWSFVVFPTRAAFDATGDVIIYHLHRSHASGKSKCPSARTNSFT